MSAPQGFWKTLPSRLNAWITELEYRARNARPFAWGHGAKRVFYPGCSLPAADPALVMKSYEWLKARDPSVELWSDCCGMPLEKFSTPEAAQRGREATKQKLAVAGTTEIITACGNCTVQFGKLGLKDVKVTSLYALLAEEEWGPRASAVASVVHHPCSARIDRQQQVHFKALADRLGLQLSNADDPKHPLPCCLAKGPSATAKRGALKDSQLVTYCAHCTVAFQKDVPTRHVLQETFGSEERWRHRGKLGRFLQYFRFARLATKRLGAPQPASTRKAEVAGPAETGWSGKAFAFGALLLGMATFAFTRRAQLAALALLLVERSRDAGVLGALLYAGAYVGSTVLLLPASVLTLGAGYAWGPVWGVAIVSPTSVLAATLSLFLGRTLFRARVEARFAKDPRLQAVDRAISTNGFKVVLLLRLSPLLPFNLLNYGLSLTRVHLRDYVLASALGMFPATVLYVYLGSMMSSASDLLSGHAPASGAAGSALYWGGLAATAGVVWWVTRLSRATLQQVLAEHAG